MKKQNRSSMKSLVSTMNDNQSNTLFERSQLTLSIPKLLLKQNPGHNDDLKLKYPLLNKIFSKQQEFRLRHQKIKLLDQNFSTQMDSPRQQMDSTRYQMDSVRQLIGIDQIQLQNKLSASQLHQNGFLLTLNDLQEKERDLQEKHLQKQKQINTKFVPENQRYLRSDYQVQFCQKLIKIPIYSTEHQSKFKNSLDKTIKQSSKLITSQCIYELLELQQIFVKQEVVYNKKMVFLIERVGVLEEDPQLLFKEQILHQIKQGSLQEQIDYLIQILSNQSEQSNEYLFDLIYQVIKYIQIHVDATRSISLYFQELFIFSIICESFGRVSFATYQIDQLMHLCNVHKLYEIKMMLYYRIGLQKNKLKHYERAILNGKKQLKFAWYFKSKSYEIKSYLLFAEAYLGMNMIQQAQIFYNKHFNSYLEPVGYNKQLGLKYMKSYLKNKEILAVQNSGSSDEIDMALLFDDTNNNLTQSDKLIGLKSFTQQFKYVIGDKQRVLNNEDYKMTNLVLVDNKTFWNQNFKGLQHQSFNRNFANFYNESSQNNLKNTQIQQIFRPNQAIPILISLLNNFKLSSINPSEKNKLTNTYKEK